MENQVSPNTNPKSDEIDLWQLFQIIGQGFDKLFRAFLRLFVYLKKNIIKLLILAIVGLAIGFGLNKITEDELKTEVIVKPNLESKDYLYEVVGEIQGKIRARDTAFFQSLEISSDQLKGLHLSIEPVAEDLDKKGEEEDIKYLELLEKFENDEIVTDVVRSEIFNKSSLHHRITFFYKDDAQDGTDTTHKLVAYINSNDYFNDLVKINAENANERIRQNNNLVQQIDVLITKYTEKMAQSKDVGAGRIILDNEERMDITGLFGLKNNLIRDIERKKLELLEQKEPIRIINIGRTQLVQKSFLGKRTVLIPLVLILLFFLFEFIKYLNSKSKEMLIQ